MARNILYINNDLLINLSACLRKWFVCSSFVASFILVLGVTVASGQGTYANDWINYAATYYKIPIASEGIYRLTPADLATAGFPMSVDPKSIRLFHRGVEQAIYIEGEDDGSFDASDYILFYGMKNDGTLDKDLYVAPEAQPHGYYNLFSDTTAYFLTIDNSNLGKRMKLVNDNATGLPEIPYHIDTKLTLYTQNYWKGLEYSVDTYLSQYDYGEGWTGTHFRGGQHRDVVFTNVTHTYTGGGKPNLEIQLTGRNANMHNVEILVGQSTNALRSLTTVNFVAHGNRFISTPIEWSDISADGKVIVRVSVQNTATTDYISIASVKLDFQQQFNMQGMNTKKFTVKNISGRSKVAIVDAPSAATIYDISDPNNISRLGATSAGGTLTTVLPASTERRLFVSNQTQNIPSIKQVDFQHIDPASYDFLIITNQALRTSTDDTGDPVAAYAAYRASIAGGSFAPIVVDIRALFDQFNYGESSPRAIREFAKFMYNNGDPEYMFIIGKGLSVTYDYYRKGPSGTSHDLVPTLGEPGSDIAFTAGLDPGAPHVPAIPTGRLTAETPQHVVAYLNKVQEIEQVPYNALWRKHLVHLSGGATESELLAFRQYVNEFKLVAESHYLGALVTTKGKKSNSAVELINIAEEVNKGVALITFFGHSGPASTDLEIGYASDDEQGYRNKGKYPFILVNGCDAGNIYSVAYTFGQDWIVTPDRGAVGFIAHSAKGLSSNLKKYTDQFYANAFADSSYINKSIGKTTQKLISQYLQDYSSSSANISQVQQMILQGDPALRIFGNNKPDYEINSDNIAVQSLDGKNVSVSSDAFNLELIVRNFGITTHDSLYVQVSRRLANGNYLYYDSIYAPVFYSDTLDFKINNYSENENFGENQFEVNIDYINSTEEMDEGNNVASISYFVPLGGTTNLYPYDFSIVYEGNPELIAQSNNVLDESRNYLFQLDTVASFDSPALSQYATSAQALAYWNPILLESLAQDSIVYYWRTKFADPKPGEDSTWAVSSFVYISKSPEGWSQSHFYQFGSNDLNGLVENNATKTFHFIESESPLKVITYGDAHPEKGTSDLKVFLNEVPYIITSGFKVCRNNAIGAIAFDRSSLESYLIIPKVAYNDPIACGRTPFVINNFNSNEIINKSRLNSYIESVPEGDYVLLFSIGSNNYESWPSTVKDALLSIGASSATLDNLKDGEPYILLGKKGGETVSELTGGRDAELTLDEKLIGKFTNGTMTSSNIGPAKSWGSLITQIDYSEAPENDEFSYDVIGLGLDNSETLLYENMSADEISLENIDADTYPSIKLKLHIADEVNLTPVQLKKWMVFYEPTPEGVLLLSNEYKTTLPKLDKQEGETLEVGYVFQNISNKDFQDSLTVSYSVFNKNSRTTEEKTKKIAPLAAKDTLQFKVQLSTLNRTGANNLKVYANPRIQAEQNYNNNIIELLDYLNVKGDEKHPTIDVAFDGEYIMDGDIVSPDPLIAVIMKDDNPFLRKKDTVGVEIRLRRPCENCTFEKVNFSNPNITWSPATEDSDFKVEFKPGTLEDGMYGLKVQAADGSNNVSGTKPYSINFEVINESSITNFYPYPNPFSSSTRFVFTLTGSEIPDQIKIQIMTVTGKIVREITQNELGQIKIGNNISEYAWNGRDEFGDQLANGVYLYRVIVVNNGDKLKQRATSADKAFKNGFGKMYLLR